MSSPGPLDDLRALLPVVKKANGRVVLAGDEVSRLRRVLRLHERLLRAGVCGCCKRLLAIKDHETVCDECECGAHQADCVHKGKFSMICADCGSDFWKPEGLAAACCEKCQAVKEADGDS